MSEIASKANNRPSSELAQPLVKRGGDAAHEMLFAPLLGGVFADEPEADPIFGGLAPVNADADADAKPDGNSDILAAMQAVAAMMSGQRGTGRNSGSGAHTASPSDAMLVPADDLAGLDGEFNEDIEHPPTTMPKGGKCVALALLRDVGPARRGKRAW